MMPPAAGPATTSTWAPWKGAAIAAAIGVSSWGYCITWAQRTNSSVCRPEVRRKWPRRTAPVRSRIARTSSGEGPHRPPWGGFWPPSTSGSYVLLVVVPVAPADHGAVVTGVCSQQGVHVLEHRDSAGAVRPLEDNIPRRHERPEGDNPASTRTAAAVVFQEDEGAEITHVPSRFAPGRG